jgi:hypothetical protein
MTENQGFVLGTDPEMWPEFDVIQDVASGGYDDGERFARAAIRTDISSG